jgi:hypothetical protein
MQDDAGKDKNIISPTRSGGSSPRLVRCCAQRFGWRKRQFKSPEIALGIGTLLISQVGLLPPATIE